MIRVLIAEDQVMILGALKALLELEGDIEVLAATKNGAEALKAALQVQPDIVITDIEMPEKTGLELAQDLKQQLPRTRVIIVTTFARAGYLRRAMEAGVKGYLLKDAPSDELADAIRRVHAGGIVINPLLAAEAWSDQDPLTDRERQVLRFAHEGMTSGQIAEKLHLSEGTVRNYLSEAMSKLGASNRVEAARMAREKGWL